MEDENLQYDEDFYQIVENLYVNYNLDFESWVDFVLEEYPFMEQVGSTFDLEYTWEQFLNTKEGKKFDKILNNYLTKEIDMIEFRDYVLDLDSEIPKKI